MWHLSNQLTSLCLEVFCLFACLFKVKTNLFKSFKTNYLFFRAAHIHKGKDMSKEKEGNYLDDSSQNQSCQRTE